MSLEFGVIQTLQHASKEAADDQLSGLLRRNAASHHVEKLILIEFP